MVFVIDSALVSPRRFISQHRPGIVPSAREQLTNASACPTAKMVREARDLGPQVVREPGGM